MMSQKQFAIAAIVAAVGAPVASAQFSEGFEHGAWLANYTVLSGSATPPTLTGAAARSGSLGVQFDQSGWWKNSSAAATISDGQTFEYYFRGSAGRAYIGFTSDDAATQAYTVVAAPNTGNVIIQRNNGFGFVDLASTPITWSSSAFYRVVGSYSGGVITAEVYNSGGALLGSTMAATGYSGGGRLLLRGFSNTQVDDIGIDSGCEWETFTWSGPGEIVGPIGVTVTSPNTLLKVTDAFIDGDQFKVYVNGSLAFTTSPPTDTGTSIGADYDAAYASGTGGPPGPGGALYSACAARLTPGRHVVEIEVIRTATGFPGGGAAWQLCDGPVPSCGGSDQIVKLGTSAPPRSICSQLMTPFGPDARPTLSDVTDVPSPLCGEINFSIPMSHRVIGGGWGTWSHGYTGDVYYTNGAASMSTAMPPDTTRFQLYAEPNPFALIEFEVSVSGAGGSSSVTEVIDGSSGAAGFGFCDDGGIKSVGVRTTDGTTDFAIGEFAIHTECDDCYADCDGNGLLDFFDFLCFQNAFAGGDPYADCDGNRVLDFFDFLCFQNEFAAGCGPSGITQLGDGPPPSSLCGIGIKRTPADPRPTFSDVTTVPTPLGDIVFDRPCSHRVIGGGWGTWSHGYTGDVYYTNGAAQLSMSLPTNKAFYFYAEPNPFADIEFEVTDGSDTVTEVISGSSGAKGFGFCDARRVGVRTTDGVTDFAVGEFGIAN